MSDPAVPERIEREILINAPVEPRKGSSTLIEFSLNREGDRT